MNYRRRICSNSSVSVKHLLLLQNYVTKQVNYTCSDNHIGVEHILIE